MANQGRFFQQKLFGGKEMNFIIGLLVYLLGCLIAQIMLEKLEIDREEWKYKWLSWTLVIVLLMRDN